MTSKDRNFRKKTSKYKAYKKHCICHSFTPLTKLVRREYLKHLKARLHENVQQWREKHKDSTFHVNEMHVQRCAQLLEQKAIDACMLAPIYQSVMQDFISKIRIDTLNCRLEPNLTQIDNMQYQEMQESCEEIQHLNANTAPTSQMTAQHSKVHKTLHSLESLPNNNNNENTANIQIPTENERVGAEMNNESEIAYKEAKIVEESEDDVEKNLARLFDEENGDDNENDTWIRHVDRNKELQVDRKIKNEHREAAIRKRKLALSIWPCELYMQRRRLNESLCQLVEEDMRWYDIVKWRFNMFFGEDSDNEFAVCSPTIELDSTLLSSCQQRIKPWIIKHLMTPLNDGLISNRYLFKELAKKLCQNIILQNQYPDELLIKNAIQQFFCLRPKVISLNDIQGLENVSFMYD